MRFVRELFLGVRKCHFLRVRKATLERKQSKGRNTYYGGGGVTYDQKWQLHFIHPPPKGSKIGAFLTCNSRFQAHHAITPRQEDNLASHSSTKCNDKHRKQNCSVNLHVITERVLNGHNCVLAQSL